MKRIETKSFLLLGLVSFALPVSLLHAAHDEIKEEVQGLDAGQESEKKSKVTLSFQHALGMASQDPVELTQEEADSSGLIQEALTKLSQGEEHTIELNPELSANVTLVQIKKILKLISSKIIEAQQAYLASKEDLFLYNLYRLSEYLLLPESFVELITDLLAQRIIEDKTQPGEKLTQSADVFQDQIDYQLGPKLFSKLKYPFFKQIKDSNTVHSVAYSADGKRIASGSDSDIIRIWDAATGVQVVAPLRGHTNSVTSVAYSPDEKRIVSGSYDRTVRIWDAATGVQVGAPLQGHTRSVLSVAFSPDGRRIASGSDDTTVRIWDTATRRQIGVPLAGHTGIVKSVAYSPDGTQIASGSWDKTVRIWDAATGALLHTLQGHTGWVLSVAYSPNGTQIASGSEDRTIRIWGVPAQYLDGRTKRWSLKKLSKDLSFETLEKQRGMSPVASDEDAKLLNSNPIKKAKPIAFNDSMVGAVGKIERREPLAPEDRIVLKDLQQLLQKAIGSRKIAGTDSSSRGYGAADLRDILESERTLSDGEGDYLRNIDQRITEILSQFDTESAVSSSEAASASASVKKE